MNERLYAEVLAQLNEYESRLTVLLAEVRAIKLRLEQLGAPTPSDESARRATEAEAKKLASWRDDVRKLIGGDVALPATDRGNGKILLPEDITPAMLCEHANEVPSSCRCPPRCYCKMHTCAPTDGPFRVMQVKSEEELLEEKQQACEHPKCPVNFDEQEAKKLKYHEVRAKYPRFTGTCPDCGASVIKYASYAHYVFGDW